MASVPFVTLHVSKSRYLAFLASRPCQCFSVRPPEGRSRRYAITLAANEIPECLQYRPRKSPRPRPSKPKRKPADLVVPGENTYFHRCREVEGVRVWLIVGVHAGSDRTKPPAWWLENVMASSGVTQEDIDALSDDAIAEAAKSIVEDLGFTTDGGPCLTK